MLTGWREIAVPIASAAIAALSGWLGYRITARRNSAETLNTEALTATRLFGEASELRASIRRLEDDLGTVQRECFDLREENENLKRLIPQILVFAQVTDFDRICQLFDESDNGWVLTTSEDDGTFKWANVAFCLALHMTLEEICASHWKDLVLPEFLEKTRRVEESAHGRSVMNFKNALRRKGGGTVWMHWFCGPYKEGATLSIVRMRIEYPLAKDAD